MIQDAYGKVIGVFFDEGTLQTCDKRKPKETPLLGVIDEGLTFEEFLFLTECNGGSIIPFPASQVPLTQFRSAILVACTRSSDDIRLVCNYDRDTLHQTGSGHYSPIAGYHAEEDRVLVLDVSRFKYASYWISVELLWQSMNAIDPLTNEARGYFLISKWPTDVSVECISGSCKLSLEQPTAREHLCLHETSLSFFDGSNIFPAISSEGTPTVEATIIAVVQSLPLFAVQLVTKWTFDVMQKYRLAALSNLKCAQYDGSNNPFQSYLSFLPDKVEYLPTNGSIACKTPCTRLIQSHVHAYAVPTECALEPFIHLFDSDVDGRLYRLLERMQIEQYLTVNKRTPLYLFGALSLLEDNESKKIDIERGLTAILLYALLTPRFLLNNGLFDSSDMSHALKDEISYARVSLGLSQLEYA